MEKELDLEVIKATQTSLGKYIKRPPLSDKLLKKPPFRFLHDIVTTVHTTTGFFEGLFEDNELISENVKEREDKIIFLNKVITVLAYTTGQNLSVKPSKVVAGQEPDKTNELLQCLAQALDKKLSSDEAVKKFKDSANTPQIIKKKPKESVKTVKKSNDSKKLTSKSTEKLLNQKKDSTERIAKTEKDKGNETKQKKKDIVITKPENTKKTQLPKTGPKKHQVEIKQVVKEEQKDVPKADINTDQLIDTNLQENYAQEIIVAESGDNKNINARNLDSKEENHINIDSHEEQLHKLDQVARGKLDQSFTITENDLNSSLSSQDLMETDNHKTENKDVRFDVNREAVLNNGRTKEVIPHGNQTEIQTLINKSLKNNSSANNSFEADDKITLPDRNTNSNASIKSNSNVIRPSSMRPSSSRPGAPRLREKLDNTVTDNENILLGKVNIIVESERNEEEEDTSIIIVEKQTDSTSQDQQQLHISSNDHGHLVQQILDSQKELSQVLGKTEIEWEFGAQRAREALNQEIEQLRFNIQALSRVANPLGKLLDHIQEDVEVMRQELHQWSNIYEQVTKEIHKQKTVNEDSLVPLNTKLKQIGVDIEEKNDKINDLKILIHKNSHRIEMLLASGNVQ